MRAAKFGTKVHLDGQAPLYTIDSVDENGNTITKTVSLGEMGKDITTNLQELIKAVGSNLGVGKHLVENSQKIRKHVDSVILRGWILQQYS
jgi:hypothetical protein